MNRIYVLCILLLLPGLSYADNCSVNATLFGTVSMGNILVQRDAPVGSEIARARLSGYAKLEVDAPDSPTSCSGGYTFNYLSATNSPINNVFNTNLDGVGIRVSVSPGSFVLPSNGTVYVYNLGFYDVMLIKTGKITPGYLTPGVIMQGWFVTPDNYFTQISLDANTQVTVLACSVSSQTLNFNLGDINASEFSNQPGFNPPRSDSQNLGLNCEASANINVELMGTQNPDVTSDTSVLALNGQGTQGTADGVGIQMLYNNVPLHLNNRIVLKRSAGGQETFPLVARYYQTRSVVRPGSANATATLNITYQ
ncbi:fimbrial protein [Citrobacter werkmanii]|uniref:fimbrial protein n=1 Tax=Citrobacter werkmanii TaxID=67827 RepID=UPI00271DB837|nr:fimbrial protein [Citrobacter werkmanii]MDO8233664.1 fimbrial protein [Citrobacter werkmanii]